MERAQVAPVLAEAGGLNATTTVSASTFPMATGAKMERLSLLNLGEGDTENGFSKEDEPQADPVSDDGARRRTLLALRFTFFLCFGSFGFLLPYLALYLRQIGLHASYVGAIAGIRPLVQFLSCPLWAVVADRYRVRKSVLIMSTVSWLLLTILLLIPRPTKITCLTGNATLTLSVNSDLRLGRNTSDQHPLKRSFVPKLASFTSSSPEVMHVRSVINHHPYNQRKRVFVNADELFEGSASEVQNISHAKKNLAAIALDDSSFSVVSYDNAEINRIFWILFGMTAFGEFLEAPAVSLLDTAMIEYLGDRIQEYGKSRLFGSVGFGVCSFMVGAALDYVQVEICGQSRPNYAIIFYFFSGFMMLTIVFSVRFVHFTYADRETGGSIMRVIHVFGRAREFSFLIAAWFLGFCHGSILNFMNWFLEDLGGSQLLMGTATVARDVGVVVGFYWSPWVLLRLTQSNVVLWSIVGYVLSFFGYSMVTNPWMVIPVEAFQGLAYSISWSACITFFGAAAPPNDAATMQGVLQGIYWGLGTGSGAIVGGVAIHRFGIIESFKFGGYFGIIMVALYAVTLLVLRMRGDEEAEATSSSRILPRH